MGRNIDDNARKDHCLLGSMWFTSGRYLRNYKTTQKFEWKKLSRDGSYFRSYTDARDTKFPAGYDVSVILPADEGSSGFDYTINANQLEVVALNEIAVKNTRFSNKFSAPLRVRDRESQLYFV